MNPFRRWRPKGKMYSLKCNQCGNGFLSSYSLDAPICGSCLQSAKSLDSTVDYDAKCSSCGNTGVIYSKKQCYTCYFGLGKDVKYKINSGPELKKYSILNLGNDDDGSRQICFEGDI